MSGMSLATAQAIVDQIEAETRGLERWVVGLTPFQAVTVNLSEAVYRRCRDEYAVLLELDGPSPTAIAVAALDLAEWVADDEEAVWWLHLAAHWLTVGVES